MAKSISHTTPLFTTGKSLIALVNLVTLVGPYLADWNETHIFNPNWPPHARYHNGQTMSLGLFTGLLTYFTLFIILPSAPPALQLIHLNWMLVLQNLVYLSSLSGILYPGAGWMDPEFGEGRPQLFGFPVFVGLCWVGWWVERKRIGRVSGKDE